MSENTPRRPAPSRPVAKRPSATPPSSDNPEPSASKGNGKKGILIGIVVVLLLINGVQFFLGEQKKKELGTTIATQSDSISQYMAQIETMELRLKDQKAEIEKLGGDVSTLESQIAELEEAKTKLKSSFNWSNNQRKALQKQLDGHKYILSQRDAEIINLKTQVDSLHQTVNQKNVALQEKENVITDLQGNVESLDTKVKNAQVLSAGNFNFIPYKKNGSAFKPIQPFKGKSIAKLYVSFKLMPNAVAMVETKTVYLQIVDSKGNIINVDESGTFSNVDGAEVFYTLKSDEMYQREGTEVNFDFVNSNDYEAGTYNVNIFVEGHLIGKGSFDIK